MRWNGASHCAYDEKSMETETTTWSVFPKGGKAIAELRRASKERNWKEQDCENHNLGSK